MPDFRFPWPRRVWMAIAAAVFLLLVVTGFGAFTPGSVAAYSSDNGPAVLVSWLIDSTLDAGVVALWLAAALGWGRTILRPLEAAGVNPQEERKIAFTPANVRAISGSSCGFTPAASKPLLSSVDPLLRRVTAVAVGLGGIGLTVLGLGLLGVFGRTAVVGILILGLALFPWRRAAAVVRPWLAGRSRGGAVAWLMAVPAAVLFVAASIPPGLLWKPLDPHPYDVTSYHLQIPREWFEAGRIMALPYNAFSYFPMGQEMHDLLLMHLLGGPWAAMYATQMVSMALVLLTAGAVVGGLRTLGVGPVVAWLSGLLTACVPWSLMIGSVAYVESGVMLYSTLAVVWGLLPLPVIRGRAGVRVFAGDEDPRRPADPHPNPPPDYRERGPETRSLVVAGVCCGLAGGVKYTALAMTAVPVFVLWPVLAWPTFGRNVIRPWLLGGLACLLCVSPWLVRNAVWTGNPVFPLATGVFGRGHFTAEQVERYAAAHSPPPAERPLPARVTAAWNRFAVDPQFAYGLLPLTGIALVALARSPAGRFGGAVLVATSGVWLLATHDMPRFLAPAIPLAALLIGLAAGRSRVGAVLGGVALLAVAAFGVCWTILALALGPNLRYGRDGLFRQHDLSVLELPEVKAVREAGGKLALVGDAQAYAYDFPPGRLKYRGVFDVVVPPGVSLADGWLGEPIEQLRAEGWTVLVSPAELVRLAGSYRNLPSPTPPFDDPAGRPILLTPFRRD